MTIEANDQAGHDLRDDGIGQPTSDDVANMAEMPSAWTGDFLLEQLPDP